MIWVFIGEAGWTRSGQPQLRRAAPKERPQRSKFSKETCDQGFALRLREPLGPLAEAGCSEGAASAEQVVRLASRPAVEISYFAEATIREGYS